MTRVLIVDDEEAIRFTFHKFLTDMGYTVSLAAHEIEAKKILETTVFDVAVVDHILSDSKGGDCVLKEIKKIQPFCEVIMISGSPSVKLEFEISKSKTFASLAKPIKKDVICRIVAEAAKKSKQNRAIKSPN